MKKIWRDKYFICKRDTSKNAEIGIYPWSRIKPSKLVLYIANTRSSHFQLKVTLNKKFLFHCYKIYYNIIEHIY